jgi:ADP-heptose:LPS heptosyltransferase
MKILVVQFLSVGDVILSTPVLRLLKTQLDNSEVHFACRLSNKPVVEANPYIDKAFYLGEVNELTNELRAEKYNYVIDLTNNLVTRILAWRLGAKSLHYKNLNLRKWLLANAKINLLPNAHRVDRYIAMLSSLTIKNDALGLDYFIPEHDQVPMDWLPETHRNGYVVFALNAQHATQLLPVKRMIELCDKINRPIILLGNHEDFEKGEAIKKFFERTIDLSYEKGLQELGKKTIIYNGCGLFNINQTASLIKQARYIFTHDSAQMHIAAAFRKEIFSIWGSSIPMFGNYPYRTKFTVLEKANLSCRPCSITGHAKCPRGHFKCMNEIVFDFYLQ